MSSNQRPRYARALRLRHLRPGELLCFLFFEGSIALGVLLALAELVPWWGVLVIPAAVALSVKVNDMVATANARVRLVPAHVRPRGRRQNGPPMPGQGTSIPGQGTSIPGQGTSIPGQGTSIPGQGTSMPGQGTSMPGQGTSIPGQRTSIPGQGTTGYRTRGPNQGRFD